MRRAYLVRLISIYDADDRRELDDKFGEEDNDSDSDNDDERGLFTMI